MDQELQVVLDELYNICSESFEGMSGVAVELAGDKVKITVDFGKIAAKDAFNVGGYVEHIKNTPYLKMFELVLVEQ